MCLLEDFLGLLRSSWELPKVEKYNCFFCLKIKLFANAGFRYFETLDGLLGSILAPLRPILGPIWPREVAQNQSENCSRICVRQQKNPLAHKEALCPCSTPKSLLGGPGLSQDAMALPRSHKASQDAPVLQGRPEASWEVLGKPRAP